MDSTYENYLNLALTAAREAGTFLKERKDIRIDDSAGKDLKLSTDKASEKIIIDILKQSNLSVLTEETGYIDGAEDYLWIVDPLDGTVNYFKGIEELTCVSIALWKNNHPILGVIYRYAQDEMYYGIVGQGAYLNGETIKPSDIYKTNQAVVATGFPVNSNYSTEGITQFIKRVQCFKKVRMLGAAAVMSVFVADGRLDAYLEENIMLWDIAAARAIVEAAGGVTSINILDENKCIFMAFANQNLADDYFSYILKQ